MYNKYAKMKLKSLLAVIVMGIGLSSFAQQPEYLQVWQKDGTWVFFRLQERPRSHVSGEKMILETDTKIIEYLLEDIQKLTFGDEDPDNMRSVAGEQPAIAVGHEIRIAGAKPDTPVNIYGLDGTVLGRFRTNAEGSLLVPNIPSAAGVVLLNVGGVTYKMTTR
jgi:hypothetical protein